MQLYARREAHDKLGPHHCANSPVVLGFPNRFVTAIPAHSSARRAVLIETAMYRADLAAKLRHRREAPPHRIHRGRSLDGISLGSTAYQATSDAELHRPLFVVDIELQIAFNGF